MSERERAFRNKAFQNKERNLHSTEAKENIQNIYMILKEIFLVVSYTMHKQKRSN